MEAIIEALSHHSLEELPQPERRLLYLAFSFMEVAPAVEFYKATCATRSKPPDSSSGEAGWLISGNRSATMV